MTTKRKTRTAPQPTPKAPEAAAPDQPADEGTKLQQGDAQALMEINQQLANAKMTLADLTAQRLDVENRERTVGADVLALNGQFQKRLSEAALNVGVNLQDGRWYFDLETMTLSRNPKQQQPPQQG